MSQFGVRFYALITTTRYRVRLESRDRAAMKHWTSLFTVLARDSIKYSKNNRYIVIMILVLDSIFSSRHIQRDPRESITLCIN
jgi:hypothetical protein